MTNILTDLLETRMGLDIEKQKQFLYLADLRPIIYKVPFL